MNFLLAKKRDDGNLKVRDCNVNNDKQDGEGNSPRDAEDVFLLHVNNLARKDVRLTGKA